MAENSKIEWTHHTFNPWWGCAKVSPGCDHCYAERDAHRRQPDRELWGVDVGRRMFGDKHWDGPIRWNSAALRNGADHSVIMRQRVFCASMADVFDKHPLAESQRPRLWRLIRDTPYLDWLLLTKRVGNVARMVPWAPSEWPANVWLGISVVNQEEADRDIPKLLELQAQVRFLSCEPLLGPILLQMLKAPDGRYLDALLGRYYAPESNKFADATSKLDWVIAGGESGPAARPMHPDWPRSIRDQCRTAGVPFLFKQHGEWVGPGHDEFGRLPERPICVIDGAGRVLDPPPQDENADALTMKRVGKKAAGRLLDGHTWDGFPR